jgi:drug/metabolite transporter (DMT)-like permease
MPAATPRAIEPSDAIHRSTRAPQHAPWHDAKWRMTASVMLIVLVGALLHASWNVLVKLQQDTYLASASVCIGAGVIAAWVLPFLPSPASGSWPYLGASVAVQLVYGMLLAAAYRVGDLGHAYPLMRGSAPLLVAIGSSTLVGERLSAAAWIGIVLVSCGILALVLDARARRRSAAATRLALLNALLIAAYTTLDGLGARASGHAFAYALWIFLLTGVPWLLFAAVRGHADRWTALGRHLPGGIIGGACSLGSYGIALWAMTLAPVAEVAAVREIAIAFGVVLGALILHERLTWARAMAAGAVTVGVCVIRLG